MPKTKKIKVHFWDQMVLIALGLALLYTIFDSILYIFLSYDVDFFQRLFGANMGATWSRLAILCFFVIFGAHAQFTINQRSEAEAALRESEAKFRTIIETTPDGYYEVDLDGNYTFFNDSMCQILGYSRRQMQGMNHRDSLDEANAEKLTATFKRVLETGEPEKSLSWTLITADGSQRFVESSISLIKDPRGRPTGFGGFLRDVTQRRRAEALYRAKLAAEAASRTKSEFLASMSHEIRTPLNAIIGLVELMLQSELSLDQREDLDVVKASAYSLLAIINNILDFSKIEAGKLEFDQTPFSLEQFIDESMKIMAMKAHEKGIELAARITPGVPDRLVGDPTRLRQVLLNLVDNAIKFTERGEVVVYVAAQDGPQSEVILHISVVDTGIGIAQDKQRSIFGAYHQADAATTRRYGGTGLGLAVSAQLVAMMGGKIKVKSLPGQGSRFRFTARLFKQQEDKSEQKVRTHPALAGLKVLVVDDNSSSRKILKELLQGWQMDVVLASNARQARQILLPSTPASNSVKLVLIDSDMPESDGFSLASWIQGQSFSDLRLVMMLTFPRLKRKNEFAQLGIAAGVVKPPGRTELYETVLEALAVKKRRQQQITAARRHAPLRPARSLKVLVAEDTPFNQKFILRLLERWQHHATLVENGRQVLEALQKERFDIVLMDVQMPKMDGLEATRAIRASEQDSGEHIPIVAMTAHAVKGDQERCLQSGMDEYVSKPIDADKLFNIVERLALPPDPLEKTAAPTAELDREMLLAAFDHDWDFFTEVVEVFFEDYPRLMDNLEQGLAQGDGDGLMRAAHSLKGMLRNFQAEDAAEIAFELEKKGKAGQLEGMKIGIEQLARHLAALEQQLRRLLEEKV